MKPRFHVPGLILLLLAALSGCSTYLRSYTRDTSGTLQGPWRTSVYLEPMDAPVGGCWLTFTHQDERIPLDGLIRGLPEVDWLTATVTESGETRSWGQYATRIRCYRKTADRVVAVELNACLDGWLQGYTEEGTARDGFADVWQPSSRDMFLVRLPADLAEREWTGRQHWDLAASDLDTLTLAAFAERFPVLGEIKVHTYFMGTCRSLGDSGWVSLTCRARLRDPETGRVTGATRLTYQVERVAIRRFNPGI